MPDFKYQFLNEGSACTGVELSYPSGDGASTIRVNFNRTLPANELNHVFENYAAVADMLGCESKVIRNATEHAIEFYSKDRSPVGSALFIIDDLAQRGYISSEQKGTCIDAIKTYDEGRSSAINNDISHAMNAAIAKAKDSIPDHIKLVVRHTPGEDHNPVHDNAALANNRDKNKGGMDGILT